MRMFFRATFPIEKGNEVIRDGSLPTKMESILSALKPEAVYFTTTDGQRSCFMVVDMKDTSEMVRIAEPFFLAFDADVEWYPVMSLDDLMHARNWMEESVQKYG